MKRTLVWLACAGFIAACSKPAPPAPPPAPAPAPVAAAPTPPPLTSGVTKANMDTAVRAQDDFYRYVNGHWLDTAQIPDDKPMTGAFVKLDDEAKENIRTIVEDAAKTPDPANKDKQKIADLYASFMDEAALETKRNETVIRCADRAFRPDRCDRAVRRFRPSGQQGFDQVRRRSAAGRSRSARSRLLPRERRQAQADSRSLCEVHREDAEPVGRQDRRGEREGGPQF